MFVCSSPVQLRLFRIIIRRRPPVASSQLPDIPAYPVPISRPCPISIPNPPTHWTPIVALPVSVAVIVVVIVAGAGGDWLAKKESLQRKELLCIYYDYYAMPYSRYLHFHWLYRAGLYRSGRADALYNV